MNRFFILEQRHTKKGLWKLTPLTATRRSRGSNSDLESTNRFPQFPQAQQIPIDTKMASPRWTRRRHRMIVYLTGPSLQASRRRPVPGKHPGAIDPSADHGQIPGQARKIFRARRPTSKKLRQLPCLSCTPPSHVDQCRLRHVFLPQQLQSQLYLSGGSSSGRDNAGRRRRLARGSRVDYWIRRVEVGVI